MPGGRSHRPGSGTDRHSRHQETDRFSSRGLQSDKHRRSHHERKDSTGAAGPRARGIPPLEMLNTQARRLRGRRVSTYGRWLFSPQRPEREMRFTRAASPLLPHVPTSPRPPQQPPVSLHSSAASGVLTTSFPRPSRTRSTKPSASRGGHSARGHGAPTAEAIPNAGSEGGRSVKEREARPPESHSPLSTGIAGPRARRPTQIKTPQACARRTAADTWR